MFLLDTDHIGVLLRQTEPSFSRLRHRISQYPRSIFVISIVSFHEQMAGWNPCLSRARDTQGVVRAYRMFQRILHDFSIAQVVSFDEAAAAVFDSLRVQRVRIATMDLRIAAAALTRDLTVLFRNTAYFRRVPGLKVEDWTQ
jgi:tRNA(fMet)-specific endonuclease VapC